MARKPPRSNPPRSINPRERDYDYPNYAPSSSSGGGLKLSYATAAILGGIFMLGVGAGMIFSSNASFTPENVASREVIDRSAPNSEICIQFGASAIVTDLRVFVTLNPFNVFVTQPVMQPGCVLRRNNWTILEQQNLVDSRQVNECKNRMNTFGFTGPLEGKPQIDCIYQNSGGGNLFVTPSGAVGPTPNTNKF
jgi:hypothetical protein